MPQRFDLPPQRIELLRAGELALVRVRVARDEVARDCRRDVAEAAPAHDFAECAHATVGTAHDAHESRAPYGTECAYGTEDTEHARGREQERDRGGIPVVS